eukprot:4741956-Pleurochrysis_carterae.AAC.1
MKERPRDQILFDQVKQAQDNGIGWRSWKEERNCVIRIGGAEGRKMVGEGFVERDGTGGIAISKPSPFEYGGSAEFKYGETAEFKYGETAE